MKIFFNKKNFLCQKKRFLVFNPLSKKLGNTIPLYTILSLSMIIDFMFNCLFISFSIAINGFMIFLAVVHFLYLPINLMIIFNIITRKLIAKLLFLLRFYLVFVFLIVYYLTQTYFIYAKKDDQNLWDLHIAFIIVKSLEDLIILFIVWSCEKNRIILNEYKYYKVK